VRCGQLQSEAVFYLPGHVALDGFAVSGRENLAVQIRSAAFCFRGLFFRDATNRKDDSMGRLLRVEFGLLEHFDILISDAFSPAEGKVILEAYGVFRDMCTYQNNMFANVIEEAKGLLNIGPVPDHFPPNPQLNWSNIDFYFRLLAGPYPGTSQHRFSGSRAFYIMDYDRDDKTFGCANIGELQGGPGTWCPPRESASSFCGHEAQ